MGSKQKKGAAYTYHNNLTISKKYEAKNNNLANVRYGSKSREFRYIKDLIWLGNGLHLRSIVTYQQGRIG
jgi:hypothetical protein